MEVYLIKTLEKENMKREIYQIGSYGFNYEVYVDYIAGAFSSIWIKNDHEQFKPGIYYRDFSAFDGSAPKFEIQTTSYGALYAEDIQQVVKGYQVALEVVDILSKLFL